MTSPQRVACSLTVVTIGVIAALPFYDPRRAAREHPAESEPADSPPVSLVATPLQIVTDQPLPTAGETRPRVSAAGPAAGPARAVRPAEADPPPIGSDFPGVSETVPPIAGGRVSTPKSLALDARTSVERDRRGTPATATPPHEAVREHQIRDGDTLRQLAQRYLGHSDYWPAIQAANRDVLRDPELLPVGQRIRIPWTASARADETSPAADHATPPLTPLVPIP